MIMRIIINYATKKDLLQWILIIKLFFEVFLYTRIYIFFFKKKPDITNMARKMICLNCGSSDLVSDRSLGGKMVCFKCGSSSFRKVYLSRKKSKIIFFVLIFLIILLIVII